MQHSNTRIHQHMVAIVRFLCIVSVVWGTVLAICLPSFAHADTQTVEASQSNTREGADSTESSEPGVVVGDNIIDSQNLLGGDLDRVNDAINDVYNRTQVTLQLMYIPHFADTTDPEQWATTYIQNTHPAKNTVFMAVASADGNVVVVVSQGSDSWLSNQETVDALTDAALGPLNQKNPDWAGSAIALSHAIIDQRYPSVGQWIQRHSTIVIAVSIVVLLALSGIVFALVRYQRRRSVRRQLERRSRSHRANTKE